MKTLLIVAPHFPPSALPPAQRARLMVRHLHRFGYRTVVLTVAHRFREEGADPWMTELAGDDFELCELPALSQGWTRKFGIGDLGLRFIPFLFPKLLSLCRQRRPDLVLYPVPPWYVLLIAPIVKALTGVPYGIDFIDPWFYEVSGEAAASEPWKFRVSRGIARRCESWVVKNASVVYSVSDGINDDLRRRHPELARLPMHAIAYGVEPSDFEGEIRPQGGPVPVVRYIGAVWEDAYPVLDALLAAFSRLCADTRLRIEFYGTSYAGGGLARPQLEPFRERHALEGVLTEEPQRVPYRKAVDLTLSADLLLLFGGVQPYYAASKLMGMVACGRPFLAFVHRDSFPARFLEQVGYPHVVRYGDDIVSGPGPYLPLLEKELRELLKGGFTPVALDHPAFREQTAYGMTGRFVAGFQSITNARSLT